MIRHVMRCYMQKVLRNGAKTVQRFAPETDIIFDENTGYSSAPKRVQQITRKTPPFLKHHVIGARLLLGKRAEGSAIRNVSKRVKAPRRIIVFGGPRVHYVGLDCDHFVVGRIDRLRDAAERYSDVCPLAKSVCYVEHVARRSCRGKKVLSRSGVADGETLPATH